MAKKRSDYIIFTKEMQKEYTVFIPNMLPMHFTFIAKVMQNYGIDTAVYAAELDFDAIFANMVTEKHYTPLPKFPATTRDFSFVCEEALEVGKIEDVMAKAGGKLVEDIALFDIYRGPQVGEDKKSVSIRVTLRAADRTLTVEETDKISAKILAALEKDLGIVLRS